MAERPEVTSQDEKFKAAQRKPTQKDPSKMKALRMRIQKFSRPGVILMATVVVIITTMVVANATQSLTTPNAAFISYSLASGANSAPITPATSKSVLVMGCCTTSNDESVGQVSMLHIPSNYIEWVGVESYNGSPSTITSGANSTAGTHIMYIDFSHVVAIQVASVDTILIHNIGMSTKSGNVTLVW